MRPSRDAGLDWLNFFVANLQTAFGAFIAVYLTGERWTQGEIGVALSIGTVAAMASQVPAGMLVDAMRNKRGAAAISIIAIMASCLLLAALPDQLPVAVAELLHGFASCMLNPAIAAISLAVAGGTAGALGLRLGRNARWGSVGSAFAALLMAGCGYLVSARAVFLLGAALAAPGLLALSWIGPAQTASDPAVPARVTQAQAGRVHGSIRALLRERNLAGFAACAAFFQLANAAMLPIAASEVTRSAGRSAELVIGACIMVPQIIAALAAPALGAAAERIGRRPVLLIGFASLPLRGALLAVISNPYAIVVVQALDGISAAVFGVMLPLIAADISRATGRFNLTMGLLGLAIGVGATLSTTVGGYTAQLSEPLAFLSLACAGLISVLLVWILVREPDAAAIRQATPEPEASARAGSPD